MQRKVEQENKVTWKKYIQLNLFDWFLKSELPEFARAKKRKQGLRAPIVVEEPSRGLQERWQQLAAIWFPQNQELLAYRVYWSKRSQKRTLASCNIDRQKVIVARELNYPNLETWLEPLLYHEMCHAVLGRSIYKKYGRSPWHGKEFRELEARHPEIASLNQWIKTRGWERAVRSDRAKRRYL
jgi:predicted SprT family Zn-dependent metalloprotease